MTENREAEAGKNFSLLRRSASISFRVLTLSPTLPYLTAAPSLPLRATSFAPHVDLPAGGRFSLSVRLLGGGCKPALGNLFSQLQGVREAASASAEGGGASGGCGLTDADFATLKASYGVKS